MDFIRPTKSDGVSVHEYERLLRLIVHMDRDSEESKELSHEMDIAGACLTEGEVERLYKVLFDLEGGRCDRLSIQDKLNETK